MNSLAHDLSGTAQDISYAYSRNLLNEIGRQSFSNDAYQWAGVPGNATNGTRNYTTNGLNQYTSAAGDTLSYNPRGLLNVNGPWIYNYDLNDRLTTASKNVSGVITSGAMAYDAEGRLRQTVISAPGPTTRNQLYDGVNLVADYDSADVLMRRYVHGPGVDEPLVVYEGAGTGTKNWQYADHLGSIIGTADGTGASTAIFTYGPFGESSLTSGQRYGYTGQRSLAALGLLYYKARFYSPSLGRFLQPDPIGYADDLNLYAYVGNNPVNFTDPSGLSRREASLFAGLSANVAQIPTGGSGGGPAADPSPGGILGALDAFNRSDFGRVLQGIPGEGAALGAIGMIGKGVSGAKTAATQIVVGTDGVANVVIQGVELSVHAAGQASKRNMTIGAIDNAMANGQAFNYIQKGETLTGFYDSITNVFVGVGQRITTVIQPTNAVNYIKNLLNRGP